MENRDRSV